MVESLILLDQSEIINSAAPFDCILVTASRHINTLHQLINGLLQGTLTDKTSIISELSYEIVRSSIMSSLKENIHIETLISALESGDFKTVLPILLLQQKSLPELTLPNKFTPLHYACRHGRLDVVQSLITNCIGYTIESRDANGCTPLHTAAKYGHFNIIEYAISSLLFSNTLPCIQMEINTKLSLALMSLFQGKLKDQHTDLNGNTPLHAACMGGNLDIVQFLVNTIGCDPMSTGNCLHLAAEHGHLNVVKYLLEEVGSDVNPVDVHGKSPAYLAAEGGHLPVLKYLIEIKGADPQFKTTAEWKSDYFHMAPGRSLVHTASCEGHLNVVEYLLCSHYCSPSCQDEEHDTPLHYASYKGHMDIVVYLIDIHHCDPLCENKKKQTPLNHASFGGHLDVVRYFTAIHHSNPLVKDTYGNTPLHYAALQGKLDVVKHFIEDMKCDPNNKERLDRIPLHHASEQGHLDVVKYLVESHHCDPLCPDVWKETPLHRASYKGHLNVVQYLNALHNSNPLVKDTYGNTPLHYAALEGKLDVVKHFIEDMKCDPNTKERLDRIPLHHASEQGHLDVVKYLVESHHCDPLCPDVWKETPLHLASYKGHLNVVQYLNALHNSNPLVKDTYGNTPLHYAALEGKLDVVKHFIEDMKCDPNTKGRCDGIPLHYASEQGHLDVVKYLVESHHCDPLCPNEYKQTPLRQASSNGHFDVVQYFTAIDHLDPLMKNMIKYFLEDMESNLNANSLFYQHSLHHAAHLGRLDVVKYLIESHHYDPSYQDENERTPLHLASLEGHLDVVKYLATIHQLDPLVNDVNYNSSLNLATLNGKFEILRYFIEEMKCDPYTRGEENQTLLHQASERGHFDIVLYLVESHHCDPLSPDSELVTPLHCASAAGHLDIVRFFTIYCKSDPLVKDDYGNTSLHKAVQNNRLEVVRFYIEDIKCDPNIRGQFGSTPLHDAIISDSFDVSKYLIDSNTCDVQLSNNSGETPFRLAIKRDDLEIIKFLMTFCRLDPYTQPDRKALLKIKSPEIQKIFDEYADPLHKAVIIGDMENVTFYIERKKWSPLLQDRHGNNLLHNAAKYGQLEVAKYLTGSGLDNAEQDNYRVSCDPSIKNKCGLTAQQIASQSGHKHVESYLLRATTSLTIAKKYALSPSICILVIGNSGSGKSTLVKALSKEKNLIGKIKKVKGVVPLTAGIIPTTLQSKVFGSVSIYDFAGHEEYYASHEIILQQATQPLVLVAVDISLPATDIKKQTLYWLSILSNAASIKKHKTFHLIVVGSHADQVSSETNNSVQQIMTSAFVTCETIKYHGFILCDCRYSGSSDMKELRQKLNSVCVSIRQHITRTESDYSNRLCASLMYYLRESVSDQVPTITVSKLCNLIKELRSPGPTLVQLANLNLLIDTCDTLCSNGHLIFLPHERNMKKSVLVLNQNIMLSKVHASLKLIKQNITNDVGMLEASQLKEILSKSLRSAMPPDLAIKYLIFTQFCTEVAPDHLLSAPENLKKSVHYFFPNLVDNPRPLNMWKTEEESYTHLYTWCLKCSNPHHFFTPRFLHILFIQLLEYERYSFNPVYPIWKNGILLVHSNATRCVIEVTDQTSQLCIAMQCVKGYEYNLVQQRSTLISLIKSLKTKVCPSIELEEFFYHPQRSYPPEITAEIPMAEVAHSVIKGEPTVVTHEDRRNPQHVLLSDLLHFDSFHKLRESVLQEIYANTIASNVNVPESTLRNVYEAVKECGQLAEMLQGPAPATEHTAITYQQLHDILAKYSIFTHGNLYVRL